MSPGLISSPARASRGRGVGQLLRPDLCELRGRRQVEHDGAADHPLERQGVDRPPVLLHMQLALDVAAGVHAQLRER